MINGTVTLEDITISFKVTKLNEVTAIIHDTLESKVEEITVPTDKFFKALSIAVHADGMPDYKTDYADAASIMKTIRWIP